MAGMIRGRIPTILFLLLFYLAPWCPFAVAAFYVSGWAKLALAVVALLGPFLQAIVIAHFWGVE
jgi:hypothetical protein